MSAEFEFSSELPVDQALILEQLNLAGVNAELMPLLRMTAPAQWRDKSLFCWPTQQPLFNSWILLFGILPIDLHSFCLESVEEGSGFQEHSSSWLNRAWRHQRRIEQTESGCRVTDWVEYSSRIPLLDKILRPVYRMVFRHRHRRLRRRYGERKVTTDV